MKQKVLSIALLAALLSSLCAPALAFADVSAKDLPASRQLVIAEFARAAGIPALSADMDAVGSFADAADIDTQFQDAVAGAVNAGIVTGYRENGAALLKPRNPVTCLEALVLLARCLPESAKSQDAVPLPAGLPGWAADALSTLPAIWFEDLVPESTRAAGAELSQAQTEVLCARLSETIATSGSLSHAGAATISAPRFPETVLSWAGSRRIHGFRGLPRPASCRCAAGRWKP